MTDAAAIPSGPRDHGRRAAVWVGAGALLVAALGALGGIAGIRVAGVVIVSAHAIPNVVHWSAGLLLLLVGLIEPLDRRPVLALAGLGFLAAAAAGAAAPEALGPFLGFDGPLPWSYNVIHALLGTGALVGAVRRGREVA